MTEKKATTEQPSPKGGNDSPKARGNGATFVIAALDMSWRMVIVVLVPIIAGFEIDQHAGTSPALTIIGFLVAMGGLFTVMRWAMKVADQKFKPKGHK